MGIHKITKILNLKNLRNTQVSPSLRIPQGVQAEASFSSSRIKVPGLLTSFGRHRNATHKSHHLILPETAHASGFAPVSVSASILAPALALAIAALGISFFSQTAYAASYINVSSGSGGTVSLGSIRPSATGVSASGSDTLTITTNCSAGYSVYVSAQNGGDTSLTNTNSSVTTNNTISASSTAVGSAATTLNSNTWGITGDSANASASKYVGLPSYADATNTALISNSSASTTGDNKSTVYYGVKVDTSLSPGTYAGDVLYTTLVADSCNVYTLSLDTNSATNVNTDIIKDTTKTIGDTLDLSTISSTNAISRTGYHLTGWKDKDNSTYTYDITGTIDINPNKASTITLQAIWEANTYTITYNANAPEGTTVTGNTENQINQAYGSTTTLQANGFTIDGYEFKGWAYSSSATEKNFDASQANVSVSTLAKNNASGSVVDTNGGTITLYAVWSKTYDANMQSWAGCANLAEGQSVRLRDIRDDKIYAVKKLPDGKCWMMQNLTIGMNGAQTLTASNTNIDDGKTYYLPPAGKQGSSTIDDSSALTATDTANFTSDAAIDKHAKTQFRTKGTDYDSASKGYTNDSDTGYYNFYTATLGFSYYNDNDVSIGTSPRDICPKGWRLPKASATATATSGSRDFTGDFAALASSYNSSASWTNGTTANRYTADSAIWNSMMTSAASPLATTTQNNYAGFSYSGSWNSTNSSASNVGSNGSYWSSSVYGANYGYDLYFLSSDIYPQNGGGKGSGFAVRCLAQYGYLVSYSSDGSDSGEPSKTSDGAVLTSDSVTMPTQGTLTKDGYEFKGWTLTSGATDATYTAEQTVTISDLIVAASSAGQTTTPGSTITLYPVWAQSVVYMQNWSGCSALAESESVTLVDYRDNKEYAVKKLPDGKCWMMQNLTIGMDGAKTLTPENTNIDDGKTYYLPPAGKQGSSTIDDSSTLTATNTANFYDATSDDRHAKTQFRTKDDNVINDSDTGYYNFYTATLGFSSYNDGVAYGSSTRDICPKSWRLPHTTDAGSTVSTIDANNDFTYLTRQYSIYNWSGAEADYSLKTTNSTAMNGMYKIFASPLATTTQNKYAGFSYSGILNNSSSNIGSDGYYWSSSVYGANLGYHLYFTSSGINPQTYSLKSYGFAVRCVTEPSMQDFDASTFSITVGTSSSLKDTRDGKLYIVKRLPDGKVWMMQNLTIGSDGAKTLTPADTNIDNGRTYYLPPAGKQGSSTIDNPSTLTATDAANFVFNADKHSKTQFRSKGSGCTSTYGCSNDSDTGYYNFYTATLGFTSYGGDISSGSSTRDICPRGWRLPHTTDAGTTVSTITTTNDFTYLTRKYSTIDWSETETSEKYNTANSTAKDNIYGYAASPLSMTTQNNYAGFSHSGYWANANTSASDIGSTGHYWSSSVRANAGSYELYTNNSRIWPQYSYNMTNGYAVRCIAK